MPYLLLVIGYTIILVMDKVLFDAHSMLHDEADHHDHDKVLKTRASFTLKNQIDELAKSPQNKDIKDALNNVSN